MKIAFLILPNMLVTSYSNAFELFQAAKMKAISEHLPAAREMILHKVGSHRKPIALQAGLEVHPDHGLSDAVYDMIFVPALWRNPRPIVNKNKTVVDWLRVQWEQGAAINATGTGVCFVAESGLLNGKAATTHWHFFENFAKDYPAVDLKRHHFITSAGKLFCAASINAQTDLVLHHVHRYIGKSVSDHLSRHFSHEVRQPYDRLSFDQEKDNAHPDEDILQAQLWMQNNLNQPDLDVQQLAELVGMSSRNFSRRFKSATGSTPAQYLQSQRHAESKDFLKNSNLSIGDIAFRVGYCDVSHFSKQFKKWSGLTPTQWRNTVRAKLFSSNSSPRA